MQLSQDGEGICPKFFLSKGISMNRHLRRDGELGAIRAVTDPRYAFLRRRLQDTRSEGATDFQTDGLRTQVGAALKLRSTPDLVKDIENEKAIGDMRNPDRAIDKVLGHKMVGPKVAACIGIIHKYHPQVQKAALGAVGAEKGSKASKGPDHIYIY